MEFEELGNQSCKELGVKIPSPSPPHGATNAQTNLNRKLLPYFPLFSSLEEKGGGNSWAGLEKGLKLNCQGVAINRGGVSKMS